MACKSCGVQLAGEVGFCPNCGTKQSVTALPEGENLLRGLYVVQDYLQRASDKLDQFWELERFYIQKQYTQRQTNIAITTAKEKSQYGLFVAGIAFCLVFGFASLLGGNAGNLMFCLVITVIFTLGKTTNSKIFLTIGAILLAITLLFWFIGLVSAFNGDLSFAASLFYLIVNVLAFIAAFIVASIMLKKYNSKVDAHNARAEASDNAYNEQARVHNEVIEQQRHELSYEIISITNEMQAETASWYPVDYYVLDCVAKFINIVKNHEADTIKEMLQIYKQDAYRSQVVDNLSDMNSKLDQSLLNQEQMIRLQRASNLIQMANLAANRATARNTGAMRNSMAAIQNGVGAIQNNVESIRENSRSAADSAWKIARNTRKPF